MVVFVIFLSGFSFTSIHNSQDSRGRWETTFLTPFYHFHPLHRHLDISQAITAESSPPHIGRSLDQVEPLVFEHKLLTTELRLHLFMICGNSLCFPLNLNLAYKTLELGLSLFNERIKANT